MESSCFYYHSLLLLYVFLMKDKFWESEVRFIPSKNEDLLLLSAHYQNAPSVFLFSFIRYDVVIKV